MVKLIDHREHSFAQLYIHITKLLFYYKRSYELIIFEASLEKCLDIKTQSKLMRLSAGAPGCGI